jgi:hypothetical protein
MTRRRIMVAALLAVVMASTGCDALMGNRRSSWARDRDRATGDWTLIGQRSIDFSRDRDTIEVASDRRFRALRVAVKGGPVEIGDMVVTFGDGSTFAPQMRSVFEEGTESRAIDLPGEGRRIQRIELASRSTSKREGKATILIYGR